MLPAPYECLHVCPYPTFLVHDTIHRSQQERASFPISLSHCCSCKIGESESPALTGTPPSSSSSSSSVGKPNGLEIGFRRKLLAYAERDSC